MLEINIDNNGTVPIYQQIVEQVKGLITEEKLKPGEQIPSVRDLAAWLLVNPSTVARAYYNLKQDGIVATSRRRGTIIVSNKEFSQKSSVLVNQSRKSANNGLSPINMRSSTMEDIKTTLTLHQAFWRVQRSV